MKKTALLGCLALLLLGLAATAEAAWWDIKQTFICVEMTDILARTPRVPGASAVELTACNRYINDRFDQAFATVVWYDVPDGFYVHRDEYTLQRGDLVVNAGLTKARLDLGDTGVLTWAATGIVHDDLSDSTVRDRGLLQYRSSREEVAHWATVTGTFETQSITAQNVEGSPSGTTIFKVIYLETQ